MTDTTPPATRRGKRKAPQPGRTVARVIVASLVGLGLVTGVGVALVYAHWNSNLDVKEVDDLVTDRPDRLGGREVNILVMGDDTRDGKRNRIDGEGGGGSDTTILFHLSADRDFAYGISIPRDTLVDRPECKKEDGTIAPAEARAMWNEAFVVGGPSCTIQQFEQLTDILVDNYVVVDFSGFKDMVNALGGVEVCIPEAIVDEESGITLDAGTREISGDEALAYVRVRKGVAGGDGSDPQRIKRQQAFMASMISTALRADILAQPTRLASFVDATTRSLTTDFDNVIQMADLARSFDGIGVDNIDFVTTPWEPDSADPNRIVWTSEVPRLWRLVRQDKALTRSFLDDSVSAADDAGDAAGDDAAGGPSASGSVAGVPSGSASPATDDGAAEESVGDEPAPPGLC